MKKIFKWSKKKIRASLPSSTLPVPSSPQGSHSHIEQPLPLSSPTSAGTITQSLSLPRLVVRDSGKEEAPSPSLPGGGIHDNGQQVIHRGSAEQLQRSDATFLYGNSASGMLLYPSPSFESDTNQVPVLSKPFYNVQSHGGRFSQVHMDNPTIYEVHGNHSIHNTHYTGPAILDRLTGYAMPGATFDSSARDPPPRCHPGTRQDILQLIQDRLSDLQKKADVSWLRGAAGVGKSAIMQTIAETEAERNTLGASLFFSRPNNRDDPQTVFTSIAFQLAAKEPSYQWYLAQQMVADPSFLEKTMEKQFKNLIAIPFAEKQLLGDHRGCVILLDGLDECKGTREQRRIIKLIGDFVSDHPTIPLQWIITSRPEQHLLDGFSEIKNLLQSSFWEKEVPIDSEQSVRDVELYLHNEFTRIRDQYHDLINAEEKWPSERQFLTVSKAASGLFIFASTVIRFIDNDEDPVYGLNLVLSVLEKQMNLRSLSVNPLALLDTLYERILSNLSSDTLDRVKLILGYLIIRASINQDDLPPRPFWICNILGLEQHTLYGALRKLRSVLDFPEPEHALRFDIRFLHASFSDYLKDQKRSHTYSINFNEIATYLWRRCMTILPQWTDSSKASASDDSVEYTWSITSLKKVRKKKVTSVFDRFQLVEYAQCWSILLREHFNNSLTSTFCLLLPIEDLMEQLWELDFSNRWTLAPFSRHTDDLFTCLETYVYPNNHKKLIRDIPFVSLDKECFLMSFNVRRWIYIARRNEGYCFRLEQNKGVPEVPDTEQPKSDIALEVLDLIDSASASRVVVKAIGAPLKRCVQLRDVRKKQTYYFPYIA